MNAIDVKDLSFSYTAEQVLSHIDFSIKEGEFVCISGGNGSGKSTLLKLISGELKPESGSVEIFEKEVSKISSFNDLGYVPQVNVVNKISFPVTCKELVSLAMYEDFGLIKIPKKKHYQKAIEQLNEMGLREYIETPFNELSGGLQQRTMICRAMINKPKILILDEPTAGVDLESKESLFELLSSLNKDKDVTIVLVTHELEAIKDKSLITKHYRLEEGSLELC